MSFRSRVASLAAAFTAALLPLAASAQGIVTRIQGGVDSAGGQAGFAATQGGLIGMVGRVIGVALSLVGVILFVIILHAGYLWMTAGGDPKKVTEARGRIMSAVIGLVIVVSAYAIAGFVLSSLAGVQGGPRPS
jgi:hypothetical protein